MRSELCIDGLDARELSSCCFDGDGGAGRDVIVLRVDLCIDGRVERDVSSGCCFGIDFGVEGIPDVFRDELGGMFTRGEREFISLAFGIRTGVELGVEELRDVLGIIDWGEYEFSSYERATEFCIGARGEGISRSYCSDNNVGVGVMTEVLRVEACALGLGVRSQADKNRERC